MPIILSVGTAVSMSKYNCALFDNKYSDCIYNQR